MFLGKILYIKINAHGEYNEQRNNGLFVEKSLILLSGFDAFLFKKLEKKLKL